MSEKNCRACKHSYLEPDAPALICGHDDSGTVGLYAITASKGLTLRGNKSLGPLSMHCGPELKKFEQHPLRNEDGTLKGS